MIFPVKKLFPVLACMLAGFFVFSGSALAAAGDLDPTFGVSGTGFTLSQLGTAGIETGALSGANAMALQSDGKAVVVGVATDSNGFNQFGLARYNTDGSLDTSFGGGGTGTISDEVVPDRTSTAFSVAIQTDGKIVVGGVLDRKLDPAGKTHAVVARYTAAGVRDTTFNAGGPYPGVFYKFKTHMPDSGIKSVVIQPEDGMILTAGWLGDGHGVRSLALARIKPDEVAPVTPKAELDTGFNGGSVKTLQLGEDAPSIDTESIGFRLILLSGGNFLVDSIASKTSDDQLHFVVSRFLANGSGLDTTFGSGGSVVTTLVTDPEEAHRPPSAAFATDAGGNIVVGGQNLLSVSGGERQFAFVRYDKDGAPDGGFNGSGINSQQLGQSPGGSLPAISTPTGVAIQSDGTLVASGWATISSGGASLVVARYQPTGAGDSGFGSLGNGNVLLQLTAGSIPSTVANATALTADGKILVAGWVRSGDPFQNTLRGEQFMIARLGKPDEKKNDENNNNNTSTSTTTTSSQTAAGSGTVVKASTKKCASRRKFRIHVRKPHRLKLKNVQVYVNGHKVKVKVGRSIVWGSHNRADVDLRNLPKGRITVTLKAKTGSGKRIIGKRHYRTCVKRVKKHRRHRL